MAKKAGRPSKSDIETKETRTRPVRVYETDADMLYWIGEVLRKGSAEILAPLIRYKLTEMYESLSEQITALQQVRAGEDNIFKQSEEVMMLNLVFRVESHRIQHAKHLTYDQIIEASLHRRHPNNVLLPTEAKALSDYLVGKKNAYDIMVERLRMNGLIK